MALALNLRGDLAKLGDAELAARLENAWHAYETHERRPWWKSTSWLWPLFSFRGPIRHPRVYRFIAALQGSSGNGWLDLLFATALSGKTVEPLVRGSDSALDVHLRLCEIRDLVDEIERRVASRERRAS